MSRGMEPPSIYSKHYMDYIYNLKWFFRRPPLLFKGVILMQQFVKEENRWYFFHSVQIHHRVKIYWNHPHPCRTINVTHYYPFHFNETTPKLPKNVFSSTTVIQLQPLSSFSLVFTVVPSVLFIGQLESKEKGRNTVQTDYYNLISLMCICYRTVHVAWGLDLSRPVDSNVCAKNWNAAAEGDGGADWLRH